MGYCAALFGRSYVQPFWYNTGLWQTNGRTDGADGRMHRRRAMSYTALAYSVARKKVWMPSTWNVSGIFLVSDGYVEVARRTGVSPLLSWSLNEDAILSRYGTQLYRRDETIPAHQELNRQIDVSLGRLSLCSWRRPGRRGGRYFVHEITGWIRSVPTTTSRPPADLWRCAVRRGHPVVTQRSSSW